MKHHNKNVKQKGLKMVNRWFKTSVVLLMVLVLLTVTFSLALHYANNRLNIEPASAFVKYKYWCEPINDQTYRDDTSVSTIEGYPTLVCDNGIVTFNIKKCDSFHIDYIYTGDEKFVYSSNDLWNKLIKKGQEYSEINSSQGWMMTSSKSVKLSLDGWYTVFGVWYENGQKNYIVNCFNKEMHFVNTINDEAISAYDRWNENKDAIKSIEGIENYLIVGADEWSRNSNENIFSDTVIIATVNHTNKTVTFTSILKETYVYIPGIGAGRIANAYNCGGMELLLQTVRENFGIDINNYFIFDYQFFISFIDALGGVDFKLEKKETEHINQYIEELYKQYKLNDLPEDHYIKGAKSAIQKLDGVQTLSYLRNYSNGDFIRAKRYKTLLSELSSNISLKNIFFLTNEVYPHITTDLSYTEYRDLLFNSQLFKKYDVSYTSIPEANKIADFKENGEYMVLLTNNDEIQKSIRRLTSIGSYDQDPTNFYDILTVLFWLALSVLVLLMLYLIFVHKYKVIYVVGDNTYIKARKYRFRKKVHLFHNDLPYEIDGYFSDLEMTAEYDEDSRMPMKNLVVYVKARGVNRETGNTEI